MSDYDVINRELAAYDPGLASRPQIVVATKIDALDEPDRLERLREHAAGDERPFFAISSVTGAGVRELMISVAREVEQIRERSPKRPVQQTDDSLEFNLQVVDSESGKLKLEL